MEEKVGRNDRTLGARGSGLGALPSLADPESWLPLLRRVARRRCERHELDDVVGDAVIALMAHVRAGTVQSLVGLARVIVIAAVSRLKERRRWSLLGASDELIPSFDRVVEPEEQRLALVTELRGQLRGEMQQWYFDRALDGWTNRRMAMVLNRDLGEVNSQLEELTAKLNTLVGGGR